MIELNKTEAVVYELLKLKQSPKAIAKTLNKALNTVNIILNDLTKHGMAVKFGKKGSRGLSFKAVEVPYKAMIPQRENQNRPKSKPNMNVLKRLIRLVGKDNLRFILNHHGKLPRRQIAAKVGIRKVDLNRIYILLDRKSDDAA